jgi:hypothetical protein
MHAHMTGIAATVCKQWIHSLQEVWPEGAAHINVRHGCRNIVEALPLRNLLDAHALQMHFSWSDPLWQTTVLAWHRKCSLFRLGGHHEA